MYENIKRFKLIKLFLIMFNSQANIQNRQLTKNLQKVRMEKEQKEKKIETQEQIIAHLMKPDQNNIPMTNGKRTRTKKRSDMKNVTNFLGVNESKNNILYIIYSILDTTVH